MRRSALATMSHVTATGARTGVFRGGAHRASSPSSPTSCGPCSGYTRWRSRLPSSAGSAFARTARPVRGQPAPPDRLARAGPDRLVPRRLVSRARASRRPAALGRVRRRRGGRSIFGSPRGNPVSIIRTPSPQRLRAAVTAKVPAAAMAGGGRRNGTGVRGAPLSRRVHRERGRFGRAAASPGLPAGVRQGPAARDAGGRDAGRRRLGRRGAAARSAVRLGDDPDRGRAGRAAHPAGHRSRVRFPATGRNSISRRGSAVLAAARERILPRAPAAILGSDRDAGRGGGRRRQRGARRVSAATSSGGAPRSPPSRRRRARAGS